MNIAEKWKNVDVAAFANGWLQEVRSGEALADELGSKVVLMGFSAPSEVKWAFLQAAVDGAKTEEELYAIAAGPFENLLGRHGEHYIDQVEERCRNDAKFARMTTAARQYMMSEAVWGRVQAVQSMVPNPL